MTKDGFRSAGDIVSAGTGGKKEGKGRKLLENAERWEPLRLSLRLAELSERWGEVAGNPLAGKTMPSACEYSGEVMNISVNVSEPALLSSVRFRRARLERAVAAFFGVKRVGVEFKVGAISRKSTAKAAPPACERRAPLLLSDAEIETEKKFFNDGSISEELALKFARLKLSIDRLSQRSR
ncbi:MAG: DciA family protein [Synergistaceae bacterium]|nr:DciA family protein [Synergistaceae bacterium]